jgi:hypothetical protein
MPFYESQQKKEIKAGNITRIQDKVIAIAIVTVVIVSKAKGRKHWSQPSFLSSAITISIAN